MVFIWQTAEEDAVNVKSEKDELNTSLQKVSKQSKVFK